MEEKIFLLNYLNNLMTMKFCCALFVIISSFLPIKELSAQVNKCPYQYFSLRTGIDGRDYFSFQVNVQGNIRLACATFSELDYYYKKNGISKLESTIVDELSRQVIIKTSVPLDSLNFFDFASVNHIRKVDITAQKGEKYFVNYYFTRLGCLKNEFASYEPAIMKHLQAWCIAASQDDETGCLVIKYKFSPLVR